jgi:hypothetical protein
MKLLIKLAIGMLPVLAVLLVVTQVVVSNKLATQGKRLAQLDREIRIERDMLYALETEVASASSLLALRERAELMGFTEPSTKQILNLTAEVPVAFGVQVQNTPLQ